MLGVLTFVAVLLVLVLAHEYGHFVVARWFGVGVEEFGFGFPPAIVKKQWHGTTYSLNWVPLGGFVRIKGEERAVVAPDSFSAQPALWRAAIIVAGVVMNILLAVMLLTVGLMSGLPQDVSDGAPAGARVRDVRHNVAAVLAASPAAGHLDVGDAIVALDGRTMMTVRDVQAYVRSRVGETVQVTVERDGRTKNIALTPALLSGTPSPVYGLGVELFTTALVSYPFYRAPFEAARLTGQLLVRITATLGETLWSFVQGRGAGVDVAGPIGIAVLTSHVARLGWVFLLQFVSLLSLNLAFINLLPFPALDGGRLLFIGLEVVRRRPVSEAFESQVHRWGFAILIMLVLIVTYFDLQRFAHLFQG